MQLTQVQRAGMPAKSLLDGLVVCSEYGTNMGFDGDSDAILPPSGKNRYVAYGCTKGSCMQAEH